MKTPTNEQKPLAVITEPNPKMAADLHQCVLAAGAISAASAIVCGLELHAVKRDLKKSQVLGFLEWFEKHKGVLGFSESTRKNYMNAAEDTKAKLLKSGDKATLRLLECAPASLTPESRAKLLKAVQKCIGVTTLMDIYLEAGIVKHPHGSRLGNSKPGESTPGEAAEPTPDLLIQDELFTPLDRVFEYWHSPIKVGAKSKVPLWQHIEKPKLREYVGKLKQMIEVVEEALKNK